MGNKAETTHPDYVNTSLPASNWMLMLWSEMLIVSCAICRNTEVLHCGMENWKLVCHCCWSQQALWLREQREQTGACLLNFRNICRYRALVYQRSKQSHGVCFSSCKDVKTMILHKKAWKTSDGIQGVTGAAKLLQALVQHACFRFVCAYCGATELHRPGCRASSLNMYISSCFTKVGNFGNGIYKHGPPHFCSTVPNSKRQQVGELLMSQIRCAHLEPMAAGGASVVSCENAVTFELCLW